ncbi:MAG: PQQ-binding-like beta-propeller repeat protein [Planctomycetales bacterium]|nr:PQQ-binding-like beta-propeller repeat protein [Planctomycetales bacterium]
MLRFATCAARLILALTYFAIAFANDVSAENWPCWRGPRGDGTSSENNVPTRWNGETGENIRWKVALPGEGHASPIVWGDRLFVVSCLTDSEERVLICLDRKSGRELWQRTVVKSPLETKHALNSYASGTPATDGELVYVAFLEVDGSTIPAPNVGKPRPITPGQMVVAAYDFEGRQKWIVRPGGFISAHGFCSSPVLFQDSVIVNGDHDGDSYVVALNRTNGEVVWRTPREHKTRSYVTPIIRDVDGRTQMVFSGSKSIVSLDPTDGSRHWYIDGPTEQFVASMVYDGQMFYMTAGFPTYHVMGIRPDGSGDVTATHVAWEANNAKCYVPSPVVVDGYLMVADDRGTANCFRAETGERLWQERLGKHFSTSLLTANGLVYFIADDGLTKVVRPGAELNVLAENPLGEDCYSSAAISDGELFIRGEKHLFCIANPERN